MARNTQRAATPQPQEPSPTLSQQPSPNPVSLQGPPADVPQPGPTPEIVIGPVESTQVFVSAPTPVVEFGNDGSITIR